MDKATRMLLRRLLVSKPNHNGRVSDEDLEQRLTQMEMLLVSLGIASLEQVWPDTRGESHERR